MIQHLKDLTLSMVVFLLILSSISPLFIAEVGLADSPQPRDGETLRNTGRYDNIMTEISNETRWTFETEGLIDSTPSIGSDGTVYFGSQDGNLYAVGPDGSKKWTFETNSTISTKPALADNGDIYFVNIEGGFYCLNEEGEKKWMRDDLLAPEHIFSGPVISSPVIREDGTVLVASEEVYSVHPNGTVEWKYNHVFEGEDHPDPGQVMSTPAVDDDGNIYLGYTITPTLHSLGMVLSLNSEGRQRWEHMLRDEEGPESGSGIQSSPALTGDGRLYVGSENEKLYAFETDGTKLWEASTFGKIVSSPAIGEDGTIYVGSKDTRLYAFNSTGEREWVFRTDGEVYSSPAIGPEGMIYFGSYDNNTYSIHPNGTERWQVETGGNVFSSPALSNDGSLYIGSFDRKLYAIGTRQEELFTLNRTEYDGYLEEGTIHPELREAFFEEGNAFKEDTELSREDGIWFIYEDGEKKYRIEIDETELTVYEVLQEEEKTGLFSNYSEILPIIVVILLLIPLSSYSKKTNG